jgi:hypothetical protein
MKKLFFFFSICCAAHTVSAQDLGLSASSSVYFPVGGTVKASPLSGFGIDLNWWNPDKGFPVFGIAGFGYHKEFPSTVETIRYTNSTGAHKGDVKQYSGGFSTRYGWEIVQPLQHLSVYGGIGSTWFRIRQEFKPDTPLLPGEFVQDSYGNSWGSSVYNYGTYTRSVLTVNAFAGVMYEFRIFNVFAQASFHYNAVGDYMPFAKAVGLNGGIFFPILRR